MKSLMALAALSVASLLSTAAQGVDYGINQTGSDSVVLYVDTAEWADVHYMLNSGGQQNFRLLATNGRLEWPLDNLNSGDVIQYSFTYYVAPGAVDTPWSGYTHGGGGSSSGGGIASVYQHCNYGGWSASLDVGPYTLGDLQALGFVNDDASAIRVSSGYQAVLYEHDNFAGGSVTLTGDDNCLVEEGFNDNVSSIVISPTDTGSFDPGTPSAGATHPRLTIHNGCPTETLWVHWLSVPDGSGGVLNAPNHSAVAASGSISYDIPDKGLAAMRFWPAFDCDSSGMDCRIGASGGPQEFGFTCPPEGCAPPIDSKFEATFGCITGIDESQCQTNPSAPGSPLGRSDWWNSSAVDGFTVPMKVAINGFCPEGPIDSGPFAGPGGPSNGQIDCSALRVADCPRNADLSSDGLFPQLANMDLLASNPATGEAGGCYSPAGKLTYANWGNTPTYTPDAPEAQMYTCPTPPISEAECRAGPADRSAYRNYIHSVCETYAYAYDDGFGLSSCPASTLTSYEVTFYCPE